MDKCQFSEFTYGYCVTEDLIIGQGTPLTAAPIFPSLIEEGQMGVGYDVRLSRPGVPLFLQFKLVHQMVRGTAYEAQRGDFQTPFYRMHLRRKSISDQHASLLALEAAGYEVYYVAPAFHTLANLNTYYAGRDIWNQSFRIRPSMIGVISDDNDHHVTFKPAGLWRKYSTEPTDERKALNSKDIATEIVHKIRTSGVRNFREAVERIDSDLESIVRTRNPLRASAEQMITDSIAINSNPIRRAGYLAQHFFDCQLMYVTEKVTPAGAGGSGVNAT